MHTMAVCKGASEGHVQGMLTRDQRTAKVCSYRVRQSSAESEACPLNVYQTNHHHHNKAVSHHHRQYRHEEISARTNLDCIGCRSRRNRHFWKTLQRLRHTLIVGTYISLFTFPTISTAPTKRSLMAGGSEQAKYFPEPPPWHNPCGAFGTTDGASKVTRRDLLSHIVIQTQISLTKAEQFKEKFMKQTFKGSTFDRYHNEMKQDYKWLPTNNDKIVPKKYQGTVPAEFLQKLKFETAIKDTYRNLQVMAVGLEQMRVEEEKNDGALKGDFPKLEHELKSVLCEMQIAILHLKVEMHPNVERSAMPDEFRDQDTTRTSMRNFIIYRDYMNMLEFTLQVFKHFETAS